MTKNHIDTAPLEFIFYEYSASLGYTAILLVHIAVLSTAIIPYVSPCKALPHFRQPCMEYDIYYHTCHKTHLLSKYYYCFS